MRTDRSWNWEALSRTSSDIWEMRLPRSLRNSNLGCWLIEGFPWRLVWPCMSVAVDCTLPFFFLLPHYYYFAHQHKAAGVKTKQNVEQRLRRLLIRCSLCWESLKEKLYANTYYSNLDKLVKLNNKLLRILQGKNRRPNVTDLYVNYRTLPLTLLHHFAVLVFVHKFVHHRHTLPDVFHNYFVCFKLIDT